MKKFKKQTYIPFDIGDDPDFVDNEFFTEELRELANNGILSTNMSL